MMTVFEMDRRIADASQADMVKAKRTRELNDAFRRDLRQGRCGANRWRQ